MKKIKILIKIAILIVIIIQFFNVRSNATTFLPDDELSCGSKYEFEEIEYKGKKITIPYTTAMMNGKKYITYSENQEKLGIKFGKGYCVRLKSKLNNDRIKNIFKMGYPNHSYEELNCENKLQAYMITQMAIFDDYYHFDLDEVKLRDNSKISKQFIENLKSFIKLSRSNVESEETVELIIDEESPYWKEEGEKYLSKTFKIICNKNIEKYWLKIKNGNENIKIVNENNEIVNELKENEKFKIIIPKDENISFEIEAKTHIKTDIVLRGINGADTYLDYLFFSDIEEVVGNLFLEHTKQEIHEETEGNSNERDSEQTTIKKYIVPDKKQIEILPQTGM